MTISTRSKKGQTLLEDDSKFQLNDLRRCSWFLIGTSTLLVDSSPVEFHISILDAEEKECKVVFGALGRHRGQSVSLVVLAKSVAGKMERKCKREVGSRRRSQKQKMWRWEAVQYFE